MYVDSEIYSWEGEACVSLLQFKERDVCNHDGKRDDNDINNTRHLIDIA